MFFYDELTKYLVNNYCSHFRILVHKKDFEFEVEKMFNWLNKNKSIFKKMEIPIISEDDEDML